MLRQVAGLEIAAESDLTAVGRLMRGQYIEQRALAGTVARHERDAVTLVDSKGDTLKEHLIAHTLGEPFYRQIWNQRRRKISIIK